MILVRPPSSRASLLNCGPDRRQQLDDDRRADVGHDAQRPDGAMLERAAGERVIHAQQSAAALGIWLKYSASAVPFKPGMRM